MFSLKICEKVKGEKGEMVDYFHDVNENQKGILYHIPVEQQKIGDSEKILYFTQMNPQDSSMWVQNLGLASEERSKNFIYDETEVRTDSVTESLEQAKNLGNVE